MVHECSQMEFIGITKEFMNNFKGVKITLFTIAITILLQVGTFLYLYGGLTTTVNMHDKNIDKILTKLDDIKLIGVVGAQEKKIMCYQAFYDGILEVGMEQDRVYRLNINGVNFHCHNNHFTNVETILENKLVILPKQAFSDYHNNIIHAYKRSHIYDNKSGEWKPVMEVGK